MTVFEWFLAGLVAVQEARLVWFQCLAARERRDLLNRIQSRSLGEYEAARKLEARAEKPKPPSTYGRERKAPAAVVVEVDPGEAQEFVREIAG